MCLNQHEVSDYTATPEFLQQAFGNRVKRIGRILPMIEPWEDPMYCKRLWCLFELYTATMTAGCKIDAILSPGQSVGLWDTSIVPALSAPSRSLTTCWAKSSRMTPARLSRRTHW